MSDSKKNLYSGIVFVMFSILVFAVSYTIPITTSDVLGSRFFPRLISGVTVMLGLIQAIGSGMVLKRDQQEVEAENREKAGVNRPMTLTIIALLLYYFLTIQLGFVLTSIIYLFCQSLILMDKESFKDKRKLAILGVVSILFPIAMNWIFWNLFSIGLPAGNLF
jgi:hypothetical protein